MDGANLISAERQRQVAGEGFTADHDCQHSDGELLAAASIYLDDVRTLGAYSARSEMNGTAPERWPWDATDWKPTLRGLDEPTPDAIVRQLVKAGALIAAEIDRLLAQP